MNHNRTILLMDDDADDRELFVNAIKEADPDTHCLVASNGQQGLDLLQSLTSDLPSMIFLDLRMPRLGGKQCLAALRSNDRFRDIPVVIYTTSRSATESAELLAMGATHFISKPTNPEEIYYLVSLALEEQSRSTQ